MAKAGRTMGFFILLALGAGLGGAAYNNYAAPGGEAEGPIVLADASQPAVELAEIEVTTVAPTDLTDEIRISGALQPLQKVRLVAEVGGRIETVTRQVGDAVAQGDILVELRTDTLQAVLRAREASLEASQAQLRLAESILERNRRLGESGVSSQAALLEAEANVLNLTAQTRGLEADIEQARIQLEDAVIRAPFDGIVSARSIEPGQAISVGTDLLEIVDISRVEAAVAVPTSRIAQVQVGQEANLSVDGFPGETFPAKVVRISPVAEAGSRAVRVYLQMDNPDERLRGGMFSTGSLKLRDFPGVIALPASAIRTDDRGDFVLKAENGRLHRQAVERGEAWAARGLVEVRSGLSSGDVVVTAPLPDLAPDVEVRIAGI